jgi:acyl-CoA synthetase (AMP-forming)/AMP-acid ligase II
VSVKGEAMRIDVDRTVTAALERRVTQHPGTVALEFSGEEWTGEQLADQAARLASGLAALGVERGTRVSILAPNLPEHVVLFLANARLGAVHAPINPQWMVEETRFLLADAGSTVLFVSPDTLEVGLEAVEGTAVREVVVVPRSMEEPDRTDADLAPGTRAVAELLGAEPLLEDRSSADDDVALWYTSGTTGRPKGAVWTHRNFLFNSLAWMDAFGVGPGNIALGAAPMAHNGLGIGAVGPMLVGGRFHLLRRVDPGEMLEVIQREGVTYMATVPAIMTILTLRAEQLGIRQLPSMQSMAIGAAPTPIDLLRKFDDFLPNCRSYHSFGASEGHFTTCPPEALPEKLGSVGRPLAGNEVKIVDGDGNELAADEIGAIAVRGPGIMRGYWRNGEATARVLRDGWVSIGDLGRIDEDGFLWIVGRDRDVINSGGFNVYASEVEGVVASVPGVQTVAVIGQDDPVLGQKVVCYVAPHEGAAVGRDAVAAACEQRLAKYKRPREVHVVDTLPVNALGKVQKHLIELSVPDRAGN